MAKKKAAAKSKNAAQAVNLTGPLALALLAILQDLKEAGAETIDEAIAIAAESAPEVEEVDGDEEDEAGAG